MSKYPIVDARKPVESIEDIELLPGFTIVEHSAMCTRLILPNEFDVTVTRAGPYLFDILNHEPDMEPLGPYVIKIRLMDKLNPPGIEVDHEYEPPRDENGDTYCPDEVEHPKAYAYYHGWVHHERMRRERQLDIADRRKDLALSNCVFVNDGPINMDDDEWLDLIADFVGTDVDRRLLFLKSQVITSDTIRYVVMWLWHVEEVTIEGLKSAFDSFWSRISWEKSLRIVR